MSNVNFLLKLINETSRHRRERMLTRPFWHKYKTERLF